MPFSAYPFNTVEFGGVFPQTFAVSRCFTGAGILRNGRPDPFAKCFDDLLQLGQRFAGGAVKEGGQDGIIFKRMAALGNFTHGEQNLTHTIHCQRVQPGGDDHKIGCHQPVDMQHIQRRSHIQQNRIVIQILQRVGQNGFTEVGDGDLAFDLFGHLVAGENIQVFAGMHNHFAQRHFIDDQVEQAGRFFEAEGKGHMPLRIEINQQGAAAESGQSMGEGDGGGGLSDAAFLIGEGDGFHKVWNEVP